MSKLLWLNTGFTACIKAHPEYIHLKLLGYKSFGSFNRGGKGKVWQRKWGPRSCEHIWVMSSVLAIVHGAPCLFCWLLVLCLNPGFVVQVALKKKKTQNNQQNLADFVTVLMTNCISRGQNPTVLTFCVSSMFSFFQILICTLES